MIEEILGICKRLFQLAEEFEIIVSRQVHLVPDRQCLLAIPLVNVEAGFRDFGKEDIVFNLHIKLDSHSEFIVEYLCVR